MERRGEGESERENAKERSRMVNGPNAIKDIIFSTVEKEGGGKKKKRKGEEGKETKKRRRKRKGTEGGRKTGSRKLSW